MCVSVCARRQGFGAAALRPQTFEEQTKTQTSALIPQGALYTSSCFCCLNFALRPASEGDFGSLILSATLMKNDAESNYCITPGNGMYA